MGEVKARDTRLDRLVALKILHRTKATDPDFRDRFNREARAVAALAHPNIVTIHSIEEHAGSPFLTMELVEGRTLVEIIPPGGMSLPPFLEIAIAVELLGDAFARGLSMSTGLHRQMDFESLRGFAPFDELMKPKG